MGEGEVMGKKRFFIKQVFHIIIGILMFVGCIRILKPVDEMGRSDTLGMYLVGLAIVVYIVMRIYLKKTK